MIPLRALFLGGIAARMSLLTAPRSLSPMAPTPGTLNAGRNKAKRKQEATRREYIAFYKDVPHTGWKCEWRRRDAAVRASQVQP